MDTKLLNPIEQLQRYIGQVYPLAITTITAPLYENGAWFLDLVYGAKILILEWSATTDFGLSIIGSQDYPDSNIGYGERPDETLVSLEAVQQRIAELMQ